MRTRVRPWGGGESCQGEDESQAKVKTRESGLSENQNQAVLGTTLSL